MRKASADRVEATRRMQEAIVSALGELHGVLDDEQRKKLVTLLRTEMLSI